MFIAVRDALVTWVGFPDLFSGLKSLGLNSFELAVSRKPRIEPSEKLGLFTALGFDLSLAEGRQGLAKELSTRGLSVCAFLLDNDFGKEDVKGEVDYVAEACEAAYELGVKAVRINAVMRETPGLSLLDYHKRTVKGVKACLERMEGLGVALAVENHGVIANRHGFLFRLIQDVRSDAFGLTLDTGNFYWFGYPVEDVHDVVYGFAPYTKHTHMKNGTVPVEQRDRKRKPGDMTMTPLQEGDIDLKLAVEALRDAGYTHDLTVEDESFGRFPAETRKNILTKDVDYMKNLLK